MVRYFRFEDKLDGMEIIQQYMPSRKYRLCLLKLLEHLNNFNSVTLELQKKGINLLDVRYIFDELCEVYPEFQKYLSEDADIVQCIPFEKGVIKVLRSETNKLTTCESNALKRLQIKVPQNT